MARNFEHIETAANVSDMTDEVQSGGRRLIDDIVDVLDHPLCFFSGGLLVGFLLGYFVGAHRTGAGQPLTLAPQASAL
jgi:hypothetical protein